MFKLDVLALAFRFQSPHLPCHAMCRKEQGANSDAGLCDCIQSGDFHDKLCSQAKPFLFAPRRLARAPLHLKRTIRDVGLGSSDIIF